MVADSVVKEIEFSALFYIGSIPVLISFVAVALLAYYDNWDPIMVAFRRMSVSICYRKKPIRYTQNHNYVYNLLAKLALLIVFLFFSTEIFVILEIPFLIEFKNST